MRHHPLLLHPDDDDDDDVVVVMWLFVVFCEKRKELKKESGTKNDEDDMFRRCLFCFPLQYDCCISISSEACDPKCVSKGPQFRYVVDSN